MPYEGVARERGHDLERWILAVAFGAALLLGALGLAASTPVSKTSPSGETRMNAPSATLVAKIADSDSDRGPGETEPELASHPVGAR